MRPNSLRNPPPPPPTNHNPYNNPWLASHCSLYRQEVHWLPKLALAPKLWRIQWPYRLISLVQSVVGFYWLILNVPVPVLDPRGYPHRAGGVWSCGDQDAAVLSVRRHRQHGLAHGESRAAGTGSHQRHHIQVRRVRSTWPVRWDWIIYFRNDSVIRLDSNSIKPIQVTVSWMGACKARNQPKTAPNKT